MVIECDFTCICNGETTRCWVQSHAVGIYGSKERDKYIERKWRSQDCYQKVASIIKKIKKT